MSHLILKNFKRHRATHCLLHFILRIKNPHLAMASKYVTETATTTDFDWHFENNNKKRNVGNKINVITINCSTHCWKRPFKNMMVAGGKTVILRPINQFVFNLRTYKRQQQLDTQENRGFSLLHDVTFKTSHCWSASLYILHSSFWHSYCRNSQSHSPKSVVQ